MDDRNNKIIDAIIKKAEMVCPNSLGLIGVYGLFNPNVMNLINTTDIINVDAIKSVMYMGIGIYVAYIIFYYILGSRQLKKGVNVD